MDQMIQEHNLLIATNIEKIPLLSDLLLLDPPKTPKEEEDHFVFVKNKIDELKKKNDEMTKRIHKERLNVKLIINNIPVYYVYYVYPRTRVFKHEQCCIISGVDIRGPNIPAFEWKHY